MDDVSLVMRTLIKGSNHKKQESFIKCRCQGGMDICQVHAIKYTNDSYQ